MKKLLVVVALCLTLLTACMPDGTTGGYNLNGSIPGHASYVIRFYSGMPANWRYSFVIAANQVQNITGITFTVGPDLDPSQPAQNLSGEIRIVPGTCAVDTGLACTYRYGQANTNIMSSTTIVVTYMLLTDSQYWTGAALHEFGHAFGLAHYDGTYNGLLQIMNYAATANATEYMVGDANGLHHAACAC